MPVDQELQDAINQAAEEITGKPLSEITSGGGSEDDQPGTQVEETPEEVVEEVEEVEEEGDDLPEAQITEAKNLYRMLMNPEQRDQVISALAHRFGIIQERDVEAPPPTRAEERAQKQDITQIFEEALGPNFKFLAPLISKGVDKVLAQEREDHANEVGEVRYQQALTETNRVLGVLARETNNQSRAFENRMAELMGKYPMQSGTSVEEYVRDMYAMASSGKVKQVASKQVSDKVRRNANNVAERLSQKTGSPGGELLPSKKMSLQESVLWAHEQLTRGNATPLGGKRKK